MANVFQEPAPVATKLPYRGKPSFASMVAMAARAASEGEAREKEAPSVSPGTGKGTAPTQIMAPTAKTVPASQSFDRKETSIENVWELRILIGQGMIFIERWKSATDVPDMVIGFGRLSRKIV